jgi:hypothetical protein
VLLTSRIKRFSVKVTLVGDIREFMIFENNEEDRFRLNKQKISYCTTLFLFR